SLLFAATRPSLCRRRARQLPGADRGPTLAAFFRESRPMPFQQIPTDAALPALDAGGTSDPAAPPQPVVATVTLSGFEMAAATQPCFGETVNGDGLFVEMGRHDGGAMILLVDVAGHGDPTAVLMACLVASLGDVASQDVAPGELLQRLNGALQTPLLAARDTADGIVRTVGALALWVHAARA